jgi:hypothetical protein
MTRYKVARPDGWDFRTGSTVNYREAVGGVVEAPDWRKDGVCGGGLHYSPTAIDALSYGTIPCSLYIVEPVGERARIDRWKSKAQKLTVVEEVTDLDAAFGFRYAEACQPVSPFLLPKREPTDDDIACLREWASVWASVWDSVWASVRASVRASAQVSVRASVWVYAGSLFPGITRWKYVDHEPGVYPYQPAVDLWRRGLVPSFDGKVWRLHAGENAEVVWEGVP